MIILTCLRYEVRVVAPPVGQILLQQSVLLLSGPHELGLLPAGLGAPSSQHQTNEDDHEDQHWDDGQEYPHQGSHFDSLRFILFSATLLQPTEFLYYLIVSKKIMWKLSSSASEFRHKVPLSFVGIAFIIRRQRAADVGRIQSKFSNLDSLFSRGGQH